MGSMQPTLKPGGVVDSPSYSDKPAIIGKTETGTPRTASQPVTTPDDPSGHNTRVPGGASSYGNR